VRLVEALKVGDPSRADVELGPIINQRQLEHFDAIVKDTVAAGAVLRTGPGKGYFSFPPAGTRLRTAGRQGSELKVLLSPSSEGWIDAKDVDLLPAGAAAWLAGTALILGFISLEVARRFRKNKALMTNAEREKFNTEVVRFKSITIVFILQSNHSTSNIFRSIWWLVSPA